MTINFYQSLSIKDEIGQGHIFSTLPFLKLDTTVLTQLIPEGNEVKYKEIDIKDYIDQQSTITNTLLPVTLQPGIVITQNLRHAKKWLYKLLCN